MASQKATLILLPVRFQITGPSELIALTLAIVKHKSQEDEETKYQLEELWSTWYVTCSVSGTQIPISVLRYWDVEKQECYATPGLVPNLYWHLEHDPRPELREYWVKHNPGRIKQ